MKHGKTLQELALELNRQQNNKRDFISPMKKVNPFVHTNDLMNTATLELGFETAADMFTGGLTKNGHAQLGDFCGIPKRYYETMMAQGNVGLLAQNVKHWLNNSSDRRMIRTLDGNVRALMSDKYRRLDNFDLVNHILPMLFEANVEVDSCEVTEDRLYIKAITHKVQAEVNVGDVVSAGLCISNSEVGKGQLSVKPLVYRLVCKNGLIIDDAKFSKYHIGKANEGLNIELANDTKAAEDKAFWLTVRDAVKTVLTQTSFDKIVDRIRAATEKKFENPVNAVELITKTFDFGENEKSDIMKHLLLGGDMTSYGLGNAVTRTAQDVESYDRSTDLERFGFEIMNKNWN